MSKKLLLIISFICLTLMSCSSEQQKNSAQTKLNQSTYAVNIFENAVISDISIQENTATLEFTYTGNKQLLLEKWFILEIYENGIWYTIPYDITVTWEAIAYPIDPNHSINLAYNWNEVYTSLSAGKYRIVTKISEYVDSDISNDTSSEYYLAKEFTIH